MKRLLTLMVLAALALTVACGGDDDDDGEVAPGTVEGTPTVVPTPTPTLPPLRPDFTQDAATPGALATPDTEAIVIESPERDAKISSPIRVRGTVSEAAGPRVVINVQTERGQVLARQ